MKMGKLTEVVGKLENRLERWRRWWKQWVSWQKVGGGGGSSWEGDR